MNKSRVVCLDASLLVHFLVSGEPGSSIASAMEEWLEAGYSLIAPPLIFYELSNTLHQYVRHQGLTREEATAAFDLALRLNLATIMDGDLHKRALNLAGHHELSATYDAHYLALSERMGAEFWTLDKKLVDKVKLKMPWVNLWQD